MANACRDSGEPYVHLTPEGLWVLIGTQQGSNKGGLDSAVYARVLKYLDWIKQHLQNYPDVVSSINITMTTKTVLECANFIVAKLRTTQMAKPIPSILSLMEL